MSDEQAAPSVTPTYLERQLDIQQRMSANETERLAQDKERVEMEKQRFKLELLRMAKDIIVENKRVLPVDEKTITDLEIITLANTFNEYLK